MSKDTPDPADPIESEREDDETPSQPVEADDPERVDTVDEMTVDEMIEAEKDPAHPRHEDVMEANRQMAEKFRGVVLSASSMGSLGRMADAITKGSAFGNKGIFADPSQGKLPMSTPMGPTILQRQLAATDQVIQQLTELVRLTKTDADAQAEARKDAKTQGRLGTGFSSDG